MRTMRLPKQKVTSHAYPSQPCIFRGGEEDCPPHMCMVWEGGPKVASMLHDHVVELVELVQLANCGVEFLA